MLDPIVSNTIRASTETTTCTSLERRHVDEEIGRRGLAANILASSRESNRYHSLRNMNFTRVGAKLSSLVFRR